MLLRIPSLLLRILSLLLRTISLSITKNTKHIIVLFLPFFDYYLSAPRSPPTLLASEEVKRLLGSECQTDRIRERGRGRKRERERERE